MLTPELAEQIGNRVGHQFDFAGQFAYAQILPMKISPRSSADNKPVFTNAAGEPMAISSGVRIGAVVFQRDILVEIKNAAQAKAAFQSEFPNVP